MKKWLLISLALGVQAMAGYGPNHERAGQIQEILTSHEVGTTYPLGVSKVEKVDTGYLLSADCGQMLVDVIPLQPDSMGRPKHKLRFHTLKNSGENHG